MKIAIPTNDRETIAVHTGRAKEFYFCTIERNAIQEDHFESNQHTCKPHKPENLEWIHDDLVNQVHDAQLVVYYAMGKHLRDALSKANIRIEKAQQIKLSDIVQDVIKEFGQNID